MTIQYCSDLHLEFPDNKKYLDATPLKPVGEILLLAGDVVQFSELDNHQDFFNYLADNFRHTYWIPGNHEYYRSAISTRTGTFHEHIRNNVSLLNNTTVYLDNVRLILTTLWSSIDVAKEWALRKWMADFRLIKSGDEKLSIEAYNNLHKNSLAFLQQQLAKTSDSKTIVVTHHVPTFLNYPKKYKDSEINSGFATELYDLIEASPIHHWIYGHSHEAVPDFTIGSTILTNNQLGYVSHQEHLKFDRGKVILV